MVHGRDEYPNLHAELRLRNVSTSLLTSSTRKGKDPAGGSSTRPYSRLPRRLRPGAAEALRLPSNNHTPSTLWRGKQSKHASDEHDSDGNDNSDDDDVGSHELPQLDDSLVAPPQLGAPSAAVAHAAASPLEVASVGPPRLRESASHAGTLAKAREKPLEGTASTLGHSQSEPTLPSTRILSHATGAAPVIVLGHGRPRVRYARRSGNGPSSIPRRLPLPAFLPPAAGAIPPLADDADGGFFLTEMELDSAYVPAAKALALGAYQLYGQGQVDAALATFRHVLRIAEDLDDVVLQSLVYHHKGTAEKDAGDLTASRASHTQCIELAQSVNHGKLQGRGFKGLGVVCVSSQQYAAAYDYHVKCMAIATAENDNELASRTFANLGNVFAAKRQYADAIASHSSDLNLSTQLDSYVGMARAHRNLALVYAKMNDVAQQRHHEAEAAAKGDVPFVHDMTHHAHDVVGNLYCQVAMGSPMAKVTGQCVVELLRDLP